MAKTWFITGASSGFGKELVKAIISKGDNVAATFRKPDQADAFSQQYANQGLGVVLDVTNEDQVLAGVQQAIERFGQVDVVVNNAGYGTAGALEEFSMAEIREQMETNFFGAVAVTKLFCPGCGRRAAAILCKSLRRPAFGRWVALDCTTPASLRWKDLAKPWRRK